MKLEEAKRLYEEGLVVDRSGIKAWLSSVVFEAIKTACSAGYRKAVVTALSLSSAERAIAARDLTEMGYQVSHSLGSDIWAISGWAD